MNKLTALLLGLGLTLASQQLYAHSNHADVAPINNAEASTKAQQVLDMLISGKKLTSDWRAAKVKDISPKASHHGDTLWVVRFVNVDEKDADKQNLYIVLDEVGNVLSANHSDKL